MTINNNAIIPKYIFVFDINFSTFIKICENAHISYADIFDIDDNELLEREMRKFNLTNGKMKFVLQKV